MRWSSASERLPECRGSWEVHRRFAAMFTNSGGSWGLGGHEVFIPQSYDWGVEAQVDWYESYADLDGERTKLQVFEMRSMASGGAFHGPTRTPRSRRFLKRMSWRSATLAGFSNFSATITFQAR